MRRKKKGVLITVGVVVVLVAAFFIRDYLMFLPRDWVEGDVSKWEQWFPDDPAYEMALNSENRPMFKKPLAALEQFKKDYEKLLEQTAKNYDLQPFSKYNYWKYMLAPTGEKIFFFCLIFSDSTSEDKYIW